MLVSLAAALTAGLYLSAVPLKLALRLDWGNGLFLGLGAAVFEDRFALGMARARPFRSTRRDGGRIDENRLRSLFAATEYLRPRIGLEIRGRVGTGDAALTALLCGLGGALAGAVVPDARGAILPEFNAARAEGELAVVVTVTVKDAVRAAVIYLKERARTRG